MADFLLSVFVRNIILTTGIINYLTVLLLFFSCRWVPGVNGMKGLMKYRWYKKVYKYHAYLWWVLITSATFHATLTIFHVSFGG